jgi:OOP family OmpA-OmpF porin
MTIFERRRLVVGIAVFLLLFLIAALFGIRRIQDDQADSVLRQLQAAGITGVDVSFTGRDGTLSGPAALETPALAAVSDRDGIRSLTYEVPTAPTTSTPGTTQPAGGGSTSAAPAAGATTTPAGSAAPAQGLGVTAAVAGPNVTLSGGVPTPADKQALLAVATRSFGAGKVVDQVQARGGTWGEAGQRGFDGFRTYLAAAGPRLRAGNAVLANGGITASGSAFTAEAAAALNDTLNRLRTGGVPVNATVQASPAAANPSALQASLSELLGRSGVNFASGSATLDPTSQPVLDTAAQAIIAGPAGAQIEIGGHTDNVGSAAVNQRLSQQRAQAVRQYLVGKGVPAGRLRVVGYGASKPIASNDTPEGRAQNRRIEFTVTGS